MSDKPRCELCGEPMPDGEEMFKYHGYSGLCPKPPLPRSGTPRTDAALLTRNQGTREVFDAHEPYFAWTDYWALGEHAKKLERELKLACEERDRYKADSEALDWLLNRPVIFVAANKMIGRYDTMPEHLRKRLEGK